jgi:hypothetical protein
MIDRKLYKLPFRLESFPAWRCPTCGKGTLQLADNTFRKDERAHSRGARDCEAWEPEWIEYSFSCFLQCSAKNCTESVGLVGVGGVDWDLGYDKNGLQQQVWGDRFHPKYFFPHLVLFDIPDATPESAANEVAQSFELFFCNPPSSANHVRIALENVLTDLKIKRYETHRRKKTFLSLHSRIALLPKRHEHLKEMFLAVKWLGNAGSHSNKSVTMDDVMDAYDIVQVLLHDLYDSQAKAATKLAKSINKKKGPNRKKQQ